MKKLLCFLAAFAAIFLMVSQCSNKPADARPPAGCNFYYWKTNLKFSKQDKALADSLGMKRLYLRYFDVDWSPTLEMPVPIGSMEHEYDGEAVQIADYQVVPTVYLLNRVFERDFDADSLAAKISWKIAGISDGIYNSTSVWGHNYEDAEAPMNWDWEWQEADSLAKLFVARMDEIQIDCDWTPSTRQRYFAFLEAMKKANPGKAISCTVRLHQFRDKAKAGIPPVERGTLMCYNLAPPKELATADAIFDPALVQGYLGDGDYPLPLEAALPLFSWGALFHENQFKGLAGGLSEKEVKGNPLFVPVSAGKYRFAQDTVFSGNYMREGDLLRLDEPAPEEIAALAQKLARIKAVKSISFFDWNPSKIRTYHVDEICKKFEAGK